MRSNPNVPHRNAATSFVLRLLGRGGRGTRISPAGVRDDLSTIRCLRETYPDDLAECDCAEFLGPDGRLIWEQGAVRDVH